MNIRVQILMILVVIFLSTMPIQTAHADTPSVIVVQVNDTLTNDFDCSFPLVERIAGSYRDTLYFDQNGILTREFLSPQFQGPLTVTWTNPATGRMLESHEASTITVYYNPDGSFQKLTNQGLTFMVIVPGTRQPLLADVGRILIERGQGITFYAGVHQELFGDTGAFCNYLSGE